MLPDKLDFDYIARKVDLQSFIKIIVKDQTLSDVLAQHNLTFHDVHFQFFRLQKILLSQAALDAI